MIIYIVTIISLILVYWFQYPYIKYNKKIPAWHNIYNISKLPIIIVCLIIISYNLCFTPLNKTKDLDLDLDIFQY